MFHLTEVLQFAIPCWLVNMSLNLLYVIKLRFPKVVQIDKPLDGNLSFAGGSRILGHSTTVLGLAMAVFSGSIILIVFQQSFSKGLWLGVIVGLCVYFGHALGSFVKRRFGYKDGEFMPVADHGDYVLLTGIVLGLMHQYAWLSILVAILITYIVHPIFTYLSYLAKWHKHPL